MKQAALVTGGAVRLGRAMTLALAKYGFDIALHYHSSQNDAKEVADIIKSYGQKCLLFHADLKCVHLDKFMEQVYAAFPYLNLLVNSASEYKKASLIETDYDIFDSQFALNLRVPFFLSKEFAKRCKDGNIVNIIDKMTKFNSYHYMSYLLTKTALEKLTQSAALELAPYIRVNGISPGFILPPVAGDTENILKRIEEIPLKRQGSVKNITQTLLHIIKNDFITGQVFFVDGGDSVNCTGKSLEMFHSPYINK